MDSTKTKGCVVFERRIGAFFACIYIMNLALYRVLSEGWTSSDDCWESYTRSCHISTILLLNYDFRSKFRQGLTRYLGSRLPCGVMP